MAGLFQCLIWDDATSLGFLRKYGNRKCTRLFPDIRGVKLHDEFIEQIVVHRRCYYSPFFLYVQAFTKHLFGMSKPSIAAIRSDSRYHASLIEVLHPKLTCCNHESGETLPKISSHQHLVWHGWEASWLFTVHLMSL